MATGSTFVAIADFAAEEEGELNLSKGTTVTILEEESPTHPGWVFVSSPQGPGFVPLSFLQPTTAMAATSLSVAATASAPVAQGRALPTPSFPVVSSQSLASANKVFWQERDQAAPGGYPVVASRRWHYRDIFGDLQGPFNPEEMLVRLQRGHINLSSKVVIDVGFGAAEATIEDSISPIYPEADSAFRQPPNLSSSGPLWYYLDATTLQQGPFASAQMRLWLDSGFFSADTQVRPATPQTMVFKSLESHFPDPELAFYDDDSPPPAIGSNGAASVARSKVMTSKKASSVGKALLQSALAENPGIPPPTALSSSTQQMPPQRPPTTVAEEDDASAPVAVLLDADSEAPPPPPPKKGRGKSALVEGRVYGAGWKLFKGIPSLKGEGASTYATDLYTFLTRPLHPEAGMVEMYIKRDIDGTHVNFNKYHLYLEKGNVPLLSAYKHHHTLHNYYEIRLHTGGKRGYGESGLLIAQLELNYMGTEFLLHNDVPGHQGKPRDLLCAVYETNRIVNKGPRKMRLALPDLTTDKPEYMLWQHRASQGRYSSKIIDALKSLEVKGIVPLLNRPPKWNPRHHAYMLDFHGRVTRASVKNFQLVDALHDPQHDNVLMQHGRVGANKFTLDCKHPFSPLSAFAAAISSLHSKKGVD